MSYPTRWTRPDSYYGESWPDYYRSGFGQSRDSDALERSNFAVALDRLGGESETVIVVRESHWAVGWIEWIAIHESDARALEIARELNEKRENYPALNEDHWSELEYTEACDYWASMSISNRIDAIHSSRSDVSIFAARRADIPSDNNGALQQYLNGN